LVDVHAKRTIGIEAEILSILYARSSNLVQSQYDFEISRTQGYSRSNIISERLRLLTRLRLEYQLQIRNQMVAIQLERLENELGEITNRNDGLARQLTTLSSKIRALGFKIRRGDLEKKLGKITRANKEFARQIAALDSRIRKQQQRPLDPSQSNSELPPSEIFKTQNSRNARHKDTEFIPTPSTSTQKKSKSYNLKRKQQKDTDFTLPTPLPLLTRIRETPQEATVGGF
jgi:hypothetical protein